MTKKYLFYFGYIGSRFSGVQRQLSLRRKDKSIAAYFEEALLSLSPLNQPIVYHSSRTDKGVHALCTTCHSELSLPPLRKSGIHLTSGDFITNSLNTFFRYSALDIRIHKTIEVPKDFDARLSALGRTYLYRIAHYLPEINDKFLIDLPVVETDRCCVVSGKFDYETVQKACKILSGTHDFSFYCKVTKGVEKETTRSLQLRLLPGLPLMNEAFDERYENFKFYDVLASSGGFLYQQIRRIVTVLIGVGKGNLSLEKVEDTLDTYRWDIPLNVVKPGGLHLLSVNYPPHVFFKESS